MSTTTTESMRPVAHVTTAPAHGLRFGGAVGAEIQKIVRMRASWVLLAIGVLGFVGVMLVVTTSGTEVANSMRHAPKGGFAYLQNVLFVVFAIGSGIFLLLTSGRLVGMEYSQGTLRILLARGTGRVSLLVAKLIALMSVGAVLLAGCTVASVVWIGIATEHWTGSLSAFSTAGSGAARDLAVGLLLALLSMFCAVVIGSFMATLGRSVAFGVGAAMALFPADNFGTIILGLVGGFTHQKFWADITGYLLGPNLNMLPSLGITAAKVPVALIPPLMKVDLTHSLTVVGVWVVGLLALEIWLTWRRDVLA